MIILLFEDLAARTGKCYPVASFAEGWAKLERLRGLTELEPYRVRVPGTQGHFYNARIITL